MMQRERPLIFLFDVDIRLSSSTEMEAMNCCMRGVFSERKPFRGAMYRSFSPKCVPFARF
jgi:hypothetical protein